MIEDPALATSYRQAAYTQKYATRTLIDTPRPGGEAGFVYAPHFYDLNVLFGKVHSYMSVNVQGLSRGMFLPKALYLGVQGLRKNYLTQLGKIKELAHASLGRVPIVVGEVGLPFDINARHAYRTGDYTKQHEILDALIGAMQTLALGFTLWNYNPDNRVEYGDGWNFEDFSITNGDCVDPCDGARERGGKTLGLKQDFRNAAHEHDPLYRGGRGLDVIIRPYAVKLAGIQVFITFDVETLFFEVHWQNLCGVDSSITKDDSKEEQDARERTTEIFLPAYHYRDKRFSITTTDGETVFNAELQTLFVQHTDTRPGVVHKLKIELDDPQAHKRARLRQRRRLVNPQGVVDRVARLVPERVVLWWEALSAAQVTSLVLVALVAVVGLAIADYHMKKLMDPASSGNDARIEL